MPISDSTMRSIPISVLRACVAAYPELKSLAIEWERAGPGELHDLERTLATQIVGLLQGPISPVQLVSLASLAVGKPYGALLAGARDARVRELGAQGHSVAHIAAAIGAEGWGEISRSRVHQIIKARWERAGA